MVMISDPAAIKALYREPNHGLPPGRNIFLEPIVGSRSLLLLEGADHLANRKLMLPAFHGERMRSLRADGRPRSSTPRSTPGRSGGSSRSIPTCSRSPSR